ncbi:hypothetical protein [Shewanella vesiculosa]|uniref:hypothetical protein n=1 Tax=Shewanella vesiculosa TaxID=518738 RepID=UPI00384EA99A
MYSLSKEELACFSDLFKPKSTKGSGVSSVEDDSLAYCSLSISAEVPQVLAKILGKATLTLLADISYYRLLFPLQMKQDELGQFIPELGIPEVIDMRGAERCWRMTNVKNVQVVDNETAKFIEVLSLSSSGLTIKIPNEMDPKIPRVIQLILPGDVHVDMPFEPVRTENGVIAAKIHVEGESRIALREFLFSEHKAKFAHLYEEIIHER